MQTRINHPGHEATKSSA